MGLSRLNPTERDVAEIGDELAVARALSDLARRLMAVTANDIESVTKRRRHLCAEPTHNRERSTEMTRTQGLTQERATAGFP